MEGVLGHPPEVCSVIRGVFLKDLSPPSLPSLLPRCHDTTELLHYVLSPHEAPRAETTETMSQNKSLSSLR